MPRISKMLPMMEEQPREINAEDLLENYVSLLIRLFIETKGTLLSKDKFTSHYFSLCDLKRYEVYPIINSHYESLLLVKGLFFATILPYFKAEEVLKVTGVDSKYYQMEFNDLLREYRQFIKEYKNREIIKELKKGK